VATLRWGDFLDRNPMPLDLRDAMTRRGNPTQWLAMDQAVPLERCRGFEMYFRGAWVPVDSLKDDEADRYLRERLDVYNAAWNSLVAQIGGVERVARGDLIPPTVPLSEAEAILYDDLQQALRERGAAWAQGRAGSRAGMNGG
jgi:hypothetical protein